MSQPVPRPPPAFFVAWWCELCGFIKACEEHASCHVPQCHPGLIRVYRAELREPLGAA